MGECAPYSLTLCTCTDLQIVLETNSDEIPEADLQHMVTQHVLPVFEFLKTTQARFSQPESITGLEHRQ